MGKQELFFAKEPKIAKQEEIDSINEYYMSSDNLDSQMSPALAADKAEKEASELLIATKKYHQMLNKYKEIESEIRMNLARINDLNRDTISKIISRMDKDRHELHLATIAMAVKLGKNEQDVLVDLVRKDKTLAEYGLPEFSIFNGYDIIDNGYWYKPFIVDSGYVIEQGEYLPDRRDNGIANIERIMNYKLEGRNYEYKPMIPADSFMLAFSISALSALRLDSEIRIDKATKLAKELDGQYISKCDSCYHEGYIRFTGVIFKNNRFEEVVNYIKNSGNKFRFGQEFYSAEEKELLKKRWLEIKNYNNNKLKELADIIEKYKNALKNKTNDITINTRNIFEQMPEEYDNHPLYSLIFEINEQLNSQIFQELIYLKKTNKLDDKNTAILLEKLNNLSLEIENYFKS